MNPLNLVLSPQKLAASVAGAVIWTVAAFGAGYLYHAHRTQVAAAGQTSKQEAIVTAVAAATDTIDTQALMRLTSTAIAATNQAAQLRRQIKAQSNETPAPPDCRLPDGLRDAINASLATGQEGTVGEVRPPDR